MKGDEKISLKVPIAKLLETLGGGFPVPMVGAEPAEKAGDGARSSTFDGLSCHGDSQDFWAAMLMFSTLSSF